MIDFPLTSVTFALFVAFFALMAGAGVWLAWTRNLIHAAFALFTVLLGVTALFIFAEAEFAAVAQLIVYVGGILVLLLFGVMLTGREWADAPLSQTVNLLPGGTIAVALLGSLLYVFTPDSFVGKETVSNASSTLNSIENIGLRVFTEYLYPFEILGVLLLVALIGAAYLSREK